MEKLKQNRVTEKYIDDLASHFRLRFMLIFNNSNNNTCLTTLFKLAMCGLRTNTLMYM